ncbi:hypothetical protein [Lacrimispora sp.]|uniref:hypothetical protein n=1 Tax=Lacrimispora sp. TaxID=2719234 RepID=UPI0032E439A0
MKKVKILLLTACLSSLFTIQSFAGWIQQDNGQWIYDQNGTSVVSQWIEDQGNWYYFDENGVMLTNTTQNINGVNYTFDASGKWLDTNADNKKTSNTYKNTEYGYSLEIPTDVTTTAFDGESQIFSISNDRMLITFYNETFPEQYDPQINANAFEVGFISAFTEKVAFIDRINSQLGELATIKSRYIYSDVINLDFYACIRGNKTIFVISSYTPDSQGKTQEILNTLKLLK